MIRPHPVHSETSPAGPPGRGRASLRRWFWRGSAVAAGLLLILIVALIASCVNIAANIMITAPNRGRSIDTHKPLDADGLRARGVAEAFRVAVGPPEASLAVWIVEPAGRPRGTILYLHGIYDRKESLLPTAISHANRGYRGVLVDSRGHGESSGSFITYGACEAEDYRQVVDVLERRGLLAGRLGVYGCSYGAGVAVQFAAREPRVAAVAALAPFTSMRRIVHARTRSLGLSWIFNEQTIDAGIERACHWAGFDPADADGVAALRRRNVPLLVIHGERDRTIPVEHGRALCAAAGPASKLVVIEGATHDDWTAEGLAAIWTETTASFDRWVGPSAAGE